MKLNCLLFSAALTQTGTVATSKTVHGILNGGVFDNLSRQILPGHLHTTRSILVFGSIGSSATLGSGGVGSSSGSSGGGSGCGFFFFHFAALAATFSAASCKESNGNENK